MSSFAEIDLCETLVNIWRFAEHVFHDISHHCHCSIHLQDCILE